MEVWHGGRRFGAVNMNVIGWDDKSPFIPLCKRGKRGGFKDGKIENI